MNREEPITENTLDNSVDGVPKDKRYLYLRVCRTRLLIYSRISFVTMDDVLFLNYSLEDLRPLELRSARVTTAPMQLCLRSHSVHCDLAHQPELSIPCRVLPGVLLGACAVQKQCELNFPRQ